MRRTLFGTRNSRLNELAPARLNRGKMRVWVHNSQPCGNLEKHGAISRLTLFVTPSHWWSISEEMLSSELAKDNTLYLPPLRYEIQCLSTLLSILSPKLGSATPHPTRGRHAETVDDLLIHFATVLNIDTENNLVLALSGSPTNIFNMSLMVITKENSDGMFLYFPPILIIYRPSHGFIRTVYAV